MFPFYSERPCSPFLTFEIPNSREDFGWPQALSNKMGRMMNSTYQARLIHFKQKNTLRIDYQSCRRCYNPNHKSVDVGPNVDLGTNYRLVSLIQVLRFNFSLCRSRHKGRGIEKQVLCLNFLKPAHKVSPTLNRHPMLNTQKINTDTPS